MTDLVVRHARLADGRVVDLAAEGGRWTRIGESIPADGAEELDAGGRLATPPLVDCHLHLDASLTAGRPRYNESGTLIEGIHVWGELKESLTADDVFRRAREIVRGSVAQGTLYIRAHADVSTKNEAPLRGLLRARDELADLATIQGDRVSAGRDLLRSGQRRPVRERTSARRRLRGRYPSLRADRGARPARGAARGRWASRTNTGSRRASALISSSSMRPRRSRSCA